ncbi:MAG: Ig domain-containing protein [Gaiellales bacterium]
MRIFRLALLLGAIATIVASPAAAYKVKDTPLPAATVGRSYSFQFEAVGGTPPHSFFVLTGGLPPGLNLAQSGRLTGTPTQAGSWSFWIEARDGNVSKSQRRFTLDVGQGGTGGGGGGGGGGTTPPPPPPPAQVFQIRTTDLAPAAVGIVYRDEIRVSGGAVSSWTISSGSLPAGLALTNGEITGSPRAVGTARFTVKVSDGARTVEKPLSIRVVPAITVTLPPISPVVVGGRFEARATVKGGAAPYRFAISGATAGQVGVRGDGTVAGDGRLPGTYTFNVVVTDAAGQKAQVAARLQVTGLLGVSTKLLPAVRRGTPYRARVVAAGGVAPRKLSLVGGTLPAGLTFNPKTGRIAGTVPATASPVNVLLWFEVADMRGDHARVSLLLRVT